MDKEELKELLRGNLNLYISVDSGYDFNILTIQVEFDGETIARDYVSIAK